LPKTGFALALGNRGHGGHERLLSSICSQGSTTILVHVAAATSSIPSLLRMRMSMINRTSLGRASHGNGLTLPPSPNIATRGAKQRRVVGMDSGRQFVHDSLGC